MTTLRQYYIQTLSAVGHLSNNYNFFLFCHGFTNVNYLERVKSWKLPMWDKVYCYHCSDTVGIHCHPMVEVWIQKYNLKEHIVNVVLYKDTISHQWM